MAAHNGIQRGAVGVLPYDVSYCADTAFYGLHGCTVILGDIRVNLFCDSLNGDIVKKKLSLNRYVCEVEQNYGKYNIKIDEGK